MTTITLDAATAADTLRHATMQLALNFDVGGNRPDKATIAIGGKLSIDRQLRKGENLVIHILNDDGEIIADAAGTVVAIGFTDKTDKEGNVITTRDQKVKFDT